MATTTAMSASDAIIDQHEKRMEEEINQLMVDIRRIGEVGAPHVTFGDLFDDDDAQQYYEALVGTLKSAKKRGLIEYKGILLLKGVSDSIVISIKDPDICDLGDPANYH